MIQIFAQHIEQFKSESSFLQDNKIIPATSWIKIETTADGYEISKSNTNAFYKKRFESPLIQEAGEIICIEDAVLYSVCTSASKDIIEIIFDEKRIVLRSGKTKTSAQLNNLAEFSSIPKSEDVICRLDSRILEICDGFLDDGPIPAVTNHVFIGNGYACATNGHIGIRFPVDKTLPNICIRKEAISGFRKMNDFNYHNGGNYHIASGLNSIAGFIKPEIVFRDISKIYNPDSSISDFNIDKNEIIQFCKQCASLNKDLFPVVDLTSTGAGIRLDLLPNPYEYELSAEIECSASKFERNFRFGAKLMLRILNNVPETNVYFYKAKDKYIISGAGAWVAVIMGFGDK